MFKEPGFCPILTPTLFKIFPSKCIWFTTLTLQGNVTSPDTPGAISYSASLLVTESVS